MIIGPGPTIALPNSVALFSLMVTFAFLGLWAQRDLLAQIDPLEILNYLSERGSVDGVTRENTLTEDGLEAAEGAEVLLQLRQLTGFARTEYAREH